MKFLMTGISGMIGQEMALKLIRDGHDVYGISRQASISFLPIENVMQVDLEKEVSPDMVKGFDVIIHLAGYPVAENRWNESVKQKILTSRVNATQNLVAAINRLKPNEKPKHFISGSAIGIYGKGFLSDVTRQWEHEARQIKGVPCSIIRTGIVLSRYAGALAAMPPVIVGNGDMVMSWIHIQDWVDSCQHIIDQKLQGDFDFVAPEPVSQGHFIRALVKAKKIPFSLWAPRIAIDIGLGERSNALFESIDVRPTQLIQSGYKFKFSKIQSALDDLYQDEKNVDQVLFAAQFVPDKLDQVFNFFSEAYNLEKLTPDFLNFKIKKISSENIQAGTLIEYQLKLHGVKIFWKTLISVWEPPYRFVDEQLSGPYSKWHHTHTFEKVNKGTLITDRVVYRMPFGVFGLPALPWVKKDVQKIFNYRKKIIAEIFKNKKGE